MDDAAGETTLPGGRAYQLKEGGFTFDMGPSIVTAPDLIDDVFAASGRRSGEYLDLVPLEPFYRIFFADGRFYDYSGNPDTWWRELTKFDPAAVDGYRAFHGRERSDLSAGVLRPGPPAIPTLGGLPQGRSRTGPLRADRSVYRLRQPLLRGRSAPDGLQLPPAVHRRQSVPCLGDLQHRPVPGTARGRPLRDGWHVCADRGMVRRFQELGGTLECGTEAAEIEVEGGRAVAVRAVDGRRWPGRRRGEQCRRRLDLHQAHCTASPGARTPIGGSADGSTRCRASCSISAWTASTTSYSTTRSSCLSGTGTDRRHLRPQGARRRLLAVPPRAEYDRPEHGPTPAARACTSWRRSPTLARRWTGGARRSRSATRSFASSKMTSAWRASRTASASSAASRRSTSVGS